MARTRKDSIYIATREKFRSHVLKREECDIEARLEAATASPDLGDLAGQVREVLDQLRLIRTTART